MCWVTAQADSPRPVVSENLTTLALEVSSSHAGLVKYKRFKVAASQVSANDPRYHPPFHCIKQWTPPGLDQDEPVLGAGPVRMQVHRIRHA